MAKLIKRDQRPAPLDATATLAGDAEAHTEPAPDPQAVLEARRQQIEEEAQQRLQQAEQQAEERLHAAQDDIEARRQRAHQEGLAAGRQEGAAQLMAHLVATSERIEALQNELRPQIVALSMAIARRIVGRELEFAPETVVHIVKQALAEKARQRREITLRLHPEDAALVRAKRAELIEALSRTKEVAIQEDESIARHGVVIETEAGTIDAQLETQLNTMEHALRALEQADAP